MEGEKKSALLFVGEERIRGGINIKKRERGGVAKRDIDPYLIRLGIKRRKRRGRKFRKG